MKKTIFLLAIAMNIMSISAQTLPTGNCHSIMQLDSLTQRSRAIDRNILDDKMLAPATVQQQIQKDKLRSSVETGQKTDLGGGMYLLDDATDPTSTILEVKVNADRWDEVLSTSEALQEISNRIYSRFNDDFDFIFFVLNIDLDYNIINQLGFWGLNMSVSNDVRGLGQNVYNDTPTWGSAGKLKSVMFFPYSGAILTGPTLHELCHNWAAYICPTYTPDDIRYDGHWGVSNAGGQLGGFKYIRKVAENCDGIQGKTLYQASFDSDETNADGSFKYPGFGLNANGGNGLPYSDIELYLMGMKSAQELRDANFHLDIYSGNSYEYDGTHSFGKGYFYSTAVTSYTIDDIIAKNGARVPDASASQKQFKILTVAITPETETESYCSEIAQNVKWLAGPVNDLTYSDWLYNFRQATNNTGSLVVDNVKNSVKSTMPTLLSNITLSTGMLYPAFDPYVYDYIVNVPENVENIDVMGTSDNLNLTITGNVTELPLVINDYTDVNITVSNKNGENKIYNVSIVRNEVPPVSFAWVIENEGQKSKGIGIVGRKNELFILDWGDGTKKDSIKSEIGEIIIKHKYEQYGNYNVIISGNNKLECPLYSLKLDTIYNYTDPASMNNNVTTLDVRLCRQLNR